MGSCLSTKRRTPPDRRLIELRLPVPSVILDYDSSKSLIEQLPPNVLAEIMSYLKPRSYNRAQRACKAFYTAAKRYPKKALLAKAQIHEVTIKGRDNDIDLVVSHNRHPHGNVSQPQNLDYVSIGLRCYGTEEDVDIHDVLMHFFASVASYPTLYDHSSNEEDEEIPIIRMNQKCIRAFLKLLWFCYLSRHHINSLYLRSVRREYLTIIGACVHTYTTTGDVIDNVHLLRIDYLLPYSFTAYILAGEVSVIFPHYMSSDDIALVLPSYRFLKVPRLFIERANLSVDWGPIPADDKFIDNLPPNLQYLFIGGKTNITSKKVAQLIDDVKKGKEFVLYINHSWKLPKELHRLCKPSRIHVNHKHGRPMIGLHGVILTKNRFVLDMTTVIPKVAKSLEVDYFDSCEEYI